MTPQATVEKKLSSVCPEHFRVLISQSKSDALKDRISVQKFGLEVFAIETSAIVMNQQTLLKVLEISGSDAYTTAFNFRVPSMINALWGLLCANVKDLDPERIPCNS